jgi:hypothetical protein
MIRLEELERQREQEEQEEQVVCTATLYAITHLSPNSPTRLLLSLLPV